MLQRLKRFPLEPLRCGQAQRRSLVMSVWYDKIRICSSLSIFIVCCDNGKISVRSYCQNDAMGAMSQLVLRSTQHRTVAQRMDISRHRSTILKKKKKKSRLYAIILNGKITQWFCRIITFTTLNVSDNSLITRVFFEETSTLKQFWRKIFAVWKNPCLHPIGGSNMKF